MLHHHYYIHRIFRIKKQLGEIFLNQVILSFAISLIAVFVPLYLLDMGFTLHAAFFFFILHELSWVFFTPITVQVAYRIGAKQTLSLGIGLIIAFFSLLLFAAQFSPPSVFLIAILGGLAFNLYWSPLNTEFVKNIDKIYESQEIGESMAFPKIAVMISPFIGGVILTMLGFNLLFSIAVILMIISLIPFFFIKNYRIPKKKKPKKSWLRKNKGLAISMLLKGIYMSGSIIWPIYIFLLLSQTLPVGIAASMEGIAIAFFTLFAGWMGVKVSKRNFLMFGLFLYIITWSLRALVSTPLEIYIISFFIGVAWSFYAIPVFANFSDYARRENILKDCAERESILHFGKALPLIALFLLPISIQMIFVIVAIISLFALIFVFFDKRLG